MKYNPIVWLMKFILPSEKNIEKNKSSILNLLFNSEYQPMTTYESIKLFNEIEIEFNARLSQKYLEAKIIEADIEKQFKEKELTLTEKFANLSDNFLRNHPDISKLSFERK